MSMSKRFLPLVAIVLLVFVQACDRTVTYVQEEQTAQNCFSCHSDQETFIIAASSQWENSFHASGLNIDRGASTSCAGCHTSEGFVQRAQGEAVTSHDNPTVIHCFTCHAPPHGLQLRTALDRAHGTGERCQLRYRCWQPVHRLSHCST